MVRVLAGCHKRDINPLPKALTSSLLATVALPVVVLCVMMVPDSAYNNLAENRSCRSGDNRVPHERA